MALNKAVALTSAATITSTTTSSTQAIGPLDGLNGFLGHVSVGTVTGTSPTLDILIQHSVDGSVWTTLLTFAQLTAASASSSFIIAPASATDNLIPVRPFIRASWTIGGSNSPTFNSVTIKLHI